MKVTLVGMGPGNPELLTAAARRAVEEAEHFLRQLEGRPAPMGCWLDCEAASLERWGRAALTAAANAFLQRVEAAADWNGPATGAAYTATGTGPGTFWT